MLQANLKALHIAFALMNGEVSGGAFTRDDLQEALQACASMIRRTEDAFSKFSAGKSQHTLLKNRLQALRLAEALIAAEMGSDCDSSS